MAERSEEELGRELDEEWAREEDPSTLLDVPPDFREKLWERLHEEFGEIRRRRRVRWPWVVLGVLCLALVAYVVIANHFAPG